MHFRSQLEDDAQPGACSFRGDAHFGTLGCTYERPSTIQHWQVRAVLCLGEDT